LARGNRQDLRASQKVGTEASEKHGKGNDESKKKKRTLTSEIQFSGRTPKGRVTKKGERGETLYQCAVVSYAGRGERTP